jgi:hypothetical protein
MSKVYCAFLVIAWLLVTAALGLLILVVITDIAQLAFRTNGYYGMNP